MSARPSILRGQSLPADTLTLDDFGSRDRLGTAARAAIAEAIEEGRHDGYTAGYQAGLQAAAQSVQADAAQRRGQVQQLTAALNEAIAAFDSREALAVDDVEAAIIDSALLIARMVLARETAVATNPGAEAMARALAVAPTGPAVVRLHPGDAALFEQLAGADVIGQLAPGRSISIVADPSIEPGGCVVDVGACHIDAQLSAALKRVQELLG
jgi:flagellar assembly protein FliH